MSKRLSGGEFGTRVLAWFERHGRRDLPWQEQPTPYRVWVSEIMLQQTRVETVRPYFQRFMERFPDVQALARAEIDEVLHLWSGLGYYARARNLHRAARLITARHGGAFPDEVEAARALPGIGPSTAGAILALALGQRHPILDGNVKRLLARYRTVRGWPGSLAVARRLWALAESLTPDERLAAYTQALMDLGATVCTRRRPRCEHCPLRADCRAFAADAVALYPTPRPTRALPERAVQMLLIRDGERQVLLERRPPTGIWGGLWAFPECPPDTDPIPWCGQHLALRVAGGTPWPAIRHTFSHFHLDITPVELRLLATMPTAMEGGSRLWYNPERPGAIGLATPVARVLKALSSRGGRGGYDES